MHFNKKNMLELRKLTLEELCTYYMELRKYKYDSGISLKGIEIRKKIHKLLLTIVKIDRLIAKETVTVISDDRIKNENPKIYACTHIGGNDIQRTFEAIKEPAYLFLGDPRGIYRDASGLLLFLNGVICLETNNKEDRYIASQRAVELLTAGGNLLIYPEGAWNVTDNLPVMKLYKGAVRMARETGADIIPVAIEQYENDFFVAIGKNISMNNYNAFTIEELNNELRDAMASQKWKIWESISKCKKYAGIPMSSSEFKQGIIDKCEYGFTLEDVYNTMYKDRNEVSEEEVFSFIKKLKY